MKRNSGILGDFLDGADASDAIERRGDMVTFV
jgi:hypothetical protein